MSAGFKYLDLSALPADWTADHFGNLVDYSLGRTPPRNNPDHWKDGIYRWVSISDMTPYGVIEETAEKVSQQAFDEVFRGRMAPKGTLLMSFKLTIGRISRLGVPAFHNEAIISFNPDPEKVSPEYLGYYLSQINYKDYQDTAIKGQTLNKGKLDSLEIALPPLHEQKAIAHTLATVQRAITAQERIIQTTTELKKTLMQKLFTEGLRGEPQKETEIGLVPESWEVVELEEKADSFQYRASVKCGHDVEGKPVLRIPNVVGGHVDISDLKFGKPKRNELGKLELEPGDLLFVRTNGVKENAGRCSIFYGELADCYFASYLIRVRLDPAILNPSFLNMYSRTDVGTSFLSGKAIRTADGKFNINSGTLKSMLVPIPGIEEQEEIARTLEIVNKKTNNAVSRKSRLQELFGTLLHSLMTAQTRVHTIEITA